MNFAPSPVSTDHPRAHVALVGNQLRTMVGFRGPLIRELVARGHRVTAICPAGGAGEHAALEATGAEFVPLRAMERATIGPVGEVRLFLEFVRILRALGPTHVLCYFIKPVIYGTLAARIAGVPRRVGLIEGVGFAFSESVGGEGSRWLQRLLIRRVLTGLFRLSLGGIDRLLVLNQDDEKIFLRRGLVEARRLTRIDGIGVDLTHYTAASPVTEPITFTLAARLIREKGIAEFVVAARAIKRRRPDVRFVVLGALDDNPSAITFDEMARHVAEGVIEWPGHCPDIRVWLAQTSVYVLPSRYGEGRPRSIMEAMAMGRPVITSAAVPGCRDSITEGVSGYLVQLDAADTLRRAMETFIDDPDRIVRMGRAARLECERRYDARSANEALIAALFEPGFEPKRDMDAPLGPANAVATTAVATTALEPWGSRS